MADWMKTVDQVDDMTRAAGSGDFSRVAFEYSPEILPDVSGKDYNGTLVAKFIAPDSGMYKYEFYCKSNATEEAFIKRMYFECPPSLCAYQGAGKATYNMKTYQKLHEYVEKTVGEKTSHIYWTGNGDDDIITPFGDYIKPMIPAKIATYTKFTLYFSARRGEAVVLYLVSGIRDANSATKHSIKNQKITY